MIEKIKRTIIGGQNSPFRLRGREYRDSDRRDYRLYNEVKEKIGIFKPLMGYNKKGKLTRHDASDFGELIAYWLARKTDIPVCEVELATKKEQYYSAKSVDVRGAISYLDLQPGETVALSIEILDYYRRNHFDEYKEILLANKSVREKDLSQYSPYYNNNIEIIIPAFIAFVKDKYPNVSEKQIVDLKQRLIEMTVFDCRFANTDRNDENFGLRISKDGTEFYPIFDNEQILGFHEPVEFIEANSAASLQEHIDQKLVSRMGVTSKPEKLSYSAMMTYLFTTFPEETYKAYQKVMSVKDTDLIEMFEMCGDELDDVHKAYALRIFKSREKGFETIKDNYIDKDGRVINDNTLPGNKPMELTTRSGRASGSPKKSKTPRPPITLDD